MRRREAIIDPARVKRKEARGISQAERRGAESKGWWPLSQREVRRDSCAARTVRSASFSRLTRCQPRFHGLKGWTNGVGGVGNHKATREEEEEDVEECEKDMEEGGRGRENGCRAGDAAWKRVSKFNLTECQGIKRFLFFSLSLLLLSYIAPFSFRRTSRRTSLDFEKFSRKHEDIRTMLREKLADRIILHNRFE